VIPLPETFRSDQFDFRVLNREGDVALLAKSKPGGTTSYEVVVIQHRPAEVICGQPYPAREAMPRSEDWGVAGWSYRDRERADARFYRLVNSREDAQFHSKGLRSSPDRGAVAPMAATP
jgi:hypothetical protein